jgi:hypothetical protein
MEKTHEAINQIMKQSRILTSIPIQILNTKMITNTRNPQEIDAKRTSSSNQRKSWRGTNCFIQISWIRTSAKVGSSTAKKIMTRQKEQRNRGMWFTKSSKS